MQAMLTMDGQKGAELFPGDLVEVRRLLRMFFCISQQCQLYDVLGQDTWMLAKIIF